MEVGAPGAEPTQHPPDPVDRTNAELSVNGCFHRIFPRKTVPQSALSVLFLVAATAAVVYLSISCYRAVSRTRPTPHRILARKGFLQETSLSGCGPEGSQREGGEPGWGKRPSGVLGHPEQARKQEDTRAQVLSLGESESGGRQRPGSEGAFIGSVSAGDAGREHDGSSSEADYFTPPSTLRRSDRHAHSKLVSGGMNDEVSVDGAAMDSAGRKHNPRPEAPRHRTLDRFMTLFGRNKGGAAKKHSTSSDSQARTEISATSQEQAPAVSEMPRTEKSETDLRLEAIESLLHDECETKGAEGMARAAELLVEMGEQIDRMRQELRSLRSKFDGQTSGILPISAEKSAHGEEPNESPSGTDIHATEQMPGAAQPQKDAGRYLKFMKKSGFTLEKVKMAIKVWQVPQGQTELLEEEARKIFDEPAKEKSAHGDEPNEKESVGVGDEVRRTLWTDIYATERMHGAEQTRKDAGRYLKLMKESGFTLEDVKMAIKVWQLPKKHTKLLEEEAIKIFNGAR